MEVSTARLRVRTKALKYALDAIPSKMKTYILVFLGLAGLIAGITWYIWYLRQQMKQYPRLDEDPDSIIGTNPEPSRLGRFGLQAQNAGK
jgi:hypothetical protein